LYQEGPGLAKKILTFWIRFRTYDVDVMILQNVADEVRISFLRLEMRRMTCLQDILALPDGRQLAAQWQVGFRIIK
jgi:hypothetical protein